MTTPPQSLLDFAMIESFSLHFVSTQGLCREVEQGNFLTSRIGAPVIIFGMFASTFIHLIVCSGSFLVNGVRSVVVCRTFDYSSSLKGLGRESLQVVVFATLFFPSIIIPKTVFAALEGAHHQACCQKCLASNRQERERLELQGPVKDNTTNPVMPLPPPSTVDLPKGVIDPSPVDPPIDRVDPPATDVPREEIGEDLVDGLQVLVELYQNTRTEENLDAIETYIFNSDFLERYLKIAESVSNILNRLRGGLVGNLDLALLQGLVEHYEETRIPANLGALQTYIQSWSFMGKYPQIPPQLLNGVEQEGQIRVGTLGLGLFQGLLENYQAAPIDENLQALQIYIGSPSFRRIDPVMREQILNPLGEEARVHDFDGEELRQAMEASFNYAQPGNTLPPVNSPEVQSFLQRYIKEFIEKTHKKSPSLQRDGAEFTDTERQLGYQLWNLTFSLDRGAVFVEVFGKDRGEALLTHIRGNPPQFKRGNLFAPEQRELFDRILLQFRPGLTTQEGHSKFMADLLGDHELAPRRVELYWGLDDDGEGEDPPLLQDARDERVQGSIRDTLRDLTEEYKKKEGHLSLTRGGSEFTKGERELASEIWHSSYGFSPEDREAYYVAVFKEARGRRCYQAFRRYAPSLTSRYTPWQKALADRVLERHCQGATEEEVRHLFNGLFESRVANSLLEDRAREVPPVLSPS